MTDFTNLRKLLAVIPKVSLFWAWYDFWIGGYWDVGHKTLYICLLPTLVLRIEFSGKKLEIAPRPDRRNTLMDDALTLIFPSKNDASVGETVRIIRGDVFERRQIIQAYMTAAGFAVVLSEKLDGAIEAVRKAISQIPQGNFYQADVYNTDNEQIIHLWKNGKSYDIRVEQP